VKPLQTLSHKPFDKSIRGVYYSKQIKAFPDTEEQGITGILTNILPLLGWITRQGNTGLGITLCGWNASDDHPCRDFTWVAQLERATGTLKPDTMQVRILPQVLEAGSVGERWLTMF
jgi:hypothetical protein